jgi:hypothetical protein
VQITRRDRETLLGWALYSATAAISATTNSIADTAAVR